MVEDAEEGLGLDGDGDRRGGGCAGGDGGGGERAREVEEVVVAHLRVGEVLAVDAPGGKLQ